jgi:putative N6-adenine-specific DNA methylase
LGQAPEVQKGKVEPLAAQLVVVRLVHDHCTISLDSSGDLLHRRGYRLATAKAPLRETLAAGMLLAAGWDGKAALLDPFCGSGTIAIEAALMARGIAPGSKRSFAFMSWPGFDQGLWNRLVEENDRQVQDRMRQKEQPWIAASDRDAGAIELARANAQRAGVAAAIEFSCRAISAIEPQGVGWVVTNPPYGLRVSANKDLRNLYAQLGKMLKAKCPGWRLAILCSEMPMLGQIGMPLDTSLGLVNGGISVRLARGRV